MKHFSLFVLLLLVACNTDEPGLLLPGHGRAPAVASPLSVRYFGGQGDDHFTDILLASDGGLAILGYGDSQDGHLEGKPEEGNDFWLVRLSPEGELLWSRTYGGSKDDRGQALIETPDGGFAITGYAMSDDGDASENQGFHDNWIVKVDAAGNPEWEQSFGFAGHDHAYALAGTPDGGFYVGGFLDVTAAGGEGNAGKGGNPAAHGVGEFWLNRLDPGGNLLWRRYFGGSNNDRAHALALSPSGGAVLAGFTESTDYDISSSQGSYDFWVISVDADGTFLWERSYGGSGIDIAHDVVAVPGGYLVAGQSFSNDGMVSASKGGGDAWLIRIDENGGLLWEKSYGGGAFDLVYDISLLDDGGFLLSGSSRDEQNSGEANDLWLLRTDANGTVIWEERMATAGLSELRAGIEANDGSFYLAGTLWEQGKADGVLLHYSPGRRPRKP